MRVDGDPGAVVTQGGDPGWVTGSRAICTDDAALGIRLTADSAARISVTLHEIVRDTDVDAFLTNGLVEHSAGNSCAN